MFNITKTFQDQRREQQMKWRKELEKQRDEDEIRKKKLKESHKRDSLVDHHLFQSVAEETPLSGRPERPGGKFYFFVYSLYCIEITRFGAHRNSGSKIILFLQTYQNWSSLEN